MLFETDHVLYHSIEYRYPAQQIMNIFIPVRILHVLYT